MNPEIFHPSDPPGPSGRLVRLRRNLPWMLEKYPGGIVEIGAGYGESTKIFLEMADKFDRRVLVIDPWSGHDGVQSAESYSYEYPFTYERFMENVGEHPRLEICRTSSEDNRAFFALEDFNKPAFMMLDGRMDQEGVRSDIITAMEFDSSVVCIDDFGFRKEVRDAVESICDVSGWSAICADGAHEAYLILS